MYIFIKNTTGLEMSVNGLEFEQEGFRMYVPWHMLNARANIKHPFFSRAYVDVFVLTAPALLDRLISEGKQLGVAVIERDPKVRRREVWEVDPRFYDWCIPIPKSLIRQPQKFESMIHYYAPQVSDYVLYQGVDL